MRAFCVECFVVYAPNVGQVTIWRASFESSVVCLLLPATAFARQTNQRQSFDLLVNQNVELLSDYAYPISRRLIFN